jgi:hypothetical protein
MEKKEEKAGEESGTCCGKGHCCPGRAAFVLVLLLIGGLIGYCIGHCRRSYWACPYAMTSQPAGQAQSPSAK